MRPYVRRVTRSLICGLVLLCSLVGGYANPVPGARQAKQAEEQHPALTPLGDELSDPLIRSGEQHYYNLEYDKAIRDFERFGHDHPTDCFAVNRILKAVVFKELYRLNLLDTTMYAHDGFLAKTQPEAADPKVREKMEHLYQRALMLANNRLAEDPKDAGALYCRGQTKALRSTYMALVDKSFLPALKNAVSARRDEERVLELDPQNLDAKTLVGTGLYVVGSLPLAVKMLVGVTGLTGNKKKGLRYLREVAAADVDSSVDAKVALALFLRREAEYVEALKIVQSLVKIHPHNFLFALEEANLLKDMGDGPAAVNAYRRVLGKGSAQYPDAHFALAAYGLGESLRGQKDYAGALEAYDLAAAMKDAQAPLRRRSWLAAGEMFDLLGRRDMAIKRYKQVLATGVDDPYSASAERYLRRPFSAGKH